MFFLEYGVWNILRELPGLSEWCITPNTTYVTLYLEIQLNKNQQKGIVMLIL